MISSLTAVGALIFTALSLQATQRQVNIAERGQVTERFSRAVDQISDANSLETRLGGIYALGRIARDSTQDRDEVTRLLAAFLRHQLAVSDDGSCEPGLRRRQMDRIAALEIISHGGAATDLSRTCLIGANLDGAQLHCATLDGAHADATTTFRKADLSQAKLTGARFYLSDDTDSYLKGAILPEANLSQATLSGADLTRANLSRANLSGANLTNATLIGANLSHANLRGAILVDAKLRGINLVGADVTGAYILGADFLDSVRGHMLGMGAIDARNDRPFDACP